MKSPFDLRRYSVVTSNYSFRNLWIAGIFARTADSIAMVALPLFVYDITGSAALMSVIFIALTLPKVVLAPFSGVVADRYDRRKIIMGAAIVRCAVALILPFTSSAWQISILCLVLGVAGSLLVPAELAAVPSLVESKVLVSALSLVQVTSAITRIVAPALGAALIAVTSTKAAFWLQAGLLLVALYWLTKVQLPPREVTDEARSSTRAQINEGLHTVWHTPVVRAICAVEGLWSAVMASLGIALVVYVEEVLDLGDKSDLVYGLLLAMMATGATLGALTANRVENRMGRSRMMVLGYFGPLAWLPAFFDPPLGVLFVCMFVLGLTDAWAVISMNAYLAQSVPDELRGRIYAIWAGIVSGSLLFAYALIGWLTETIGAGATLGCAALIAGLGGPLVLWLSKPPSDSEISGNLAPAPAQSLEYNA